MSMLSSLCPMCGEQNLEGADECANCGADLRSQDLPRPQTRIERTVMQLPLTALSLTQVHVVPPDMPLEAVVHALCRQQTDLVEVVDAAGRLVGVLSVRDVVTRAGPDYRDKLDRPVSEFMTAKVETLPPDAPISFAINMMDVGGYRHVPVVRDGQVVGVASSRDVIAHLMRHSRDSVAPPRISIPAPVEQRPVMPA